MSSTVDHFSRVKITLFNKVGNSDYLSNLKMVPTALKPFLIDFVPTVFMTAVHKLSY